MKHLLLVILCLSLVLEAQAAKVACGATHNVIVKNDGTVWTWGENSSGQLGRSVIGGTTTPALVPGIQNVVSVAAGGNTTIALKSDGSVWQWGARVGGSNLLSPTLVAGLGFAVQIAVGDNHVLVILSDGSVWAWGGNSDGRLGDGTTINRTAPVKVLNLNDVVAISAGAQFSMALSATGTVYTWGNNLRGQLGNGTTSSVNQLSPSLVTGLTSIVNIAVGREHCLACSSTGIAYAWGRNQERQIGNGVTASSVNVPTALAGLSGVIKVFAGGHSSLAILGNQTSWSWGQGMLVPQQITFLNDLVEYSFGADRNQLYGHSLFLTINDMCWTSGSNYAGLRGFPAESSNRSSPMEITSLSNIRFIATSTESSWSVDQAGNFISWGTASGGPQLKTEAFPQVANLKKFSRGLSSPSYCLLNDQSLWAWGGASFGQLGTGEPLASSAVPIAVPGMTNITDVSVGNSHIIALKQNGDIWTWGNNTTGGIGSLGIGSSQFYHASPVLITGVNQVKKIAAGSTHSLVLKQDGTLWAWGKNTTRALGDGTSINRTTPVLSHTIPNVQEIAVGSDISLVLKTDGTVWTWGSAAQPALPTQVPGLTGIVKIGARLNCRYAITESGSLWVWGDNASGQLGDGTTTSRTQPVKVMDYVASVDMSGTHTLVLKEDGNVVAFGSGASGQLAEGIVANGFLPMPLLSLGSVQPTVQMVNPPNSSQLNVAGTYNFQINQTSNLQTPLAKVSVYHERALLTVDETPPFDFTFEPWTWGKFQFNCQAIDTTGKYSTFTIGSPVTVLYDSDNDLLPDWWELKYWPSLLTASSLADTDGDGISDFDEYKKGLQPNDSDTDNDGLLDGWELTYGFNPLSIDLVTGDEDDDGFMNVFESIYGTNPNLSDTDGDGLTDGHEVVTFKMYNLSPLNPHTKSTTQADSVWLESRDTDTDGLNDRWEVANGLDANSALDALLDHDEDNMTALEEYQNNSNPWRQDSDYDGYTDDIDGPSGSYANDPFNGQYAWQNTPTQTPNSASLGLTNYFGTTTLKRIVDDSSYVSVFTMYPPVGDPIYSSVDGHTGPPPGWSWVPETNLGPYESVASYVYSNQLNLLVYGLIVAVGPPEITVTAGWGFYSNLMRLEYDTGDGKPGWNVGPPNNPDYPGVVPSPPKTPPLMPDVIDEIFERDQKWNKAPSPKHYDGNYGYDDKPLGVKPETSTVLKRTVFVAVEPSSGMVELDLKGAVVNTGIIKILVGLKNHSGTMLNDFAVMSGGVAHLNFTPTSGINEGRYELCIGLDSNSNGKLDNAEVAEFPKDRKFWIRAVTASDYSSNRSSIAWDQDYAYLFVGSFTSNVLLTFLGETATLGESTLTTTAIFPINKRDLTHIAGSVYNPANGETTLDKFHLPDGSNATLAIETTLDIGASFGLRGVLDQTWLYYRSQFQTQLMSNPSLQTWTSGPLAIKPTGGSINCREGGAEMPTNLSYSIGGAGITGTMNFTIQRNPNDSTKFYLKQLDIDCAVEDIIDYDWTKGPTSESRIASIVQIGWQPSSRTAGKIFSVNIKVIQTYGTDKLGKFNADPGSGTTPP